MSKNETDILLNKYYHGETTLAEEQQLRNSLVGGDIDAMLLQGMAHLENEIEVPTDLEPNLSGLIDQWQDEERKNAKVIPMLRRHSLWKSIAATIAVIATVGLLLVRSNSPSTRVDILPQSSDNPGTIHETSVQGIIDKSSQGNAPLAQQAQVMIPSRHDSKTKPQHRHRTAHATNNKVKQMARAQTSSSMAQAESGVSDEELALAAIEKFYNVLNLGMARLQETSEKIDQIDKTIQQHLL